MSRILIVDDEPDMRLALKNVLVMRGHEVLEAEDGHSAVALVTAEKLDLVLMDIRMPGMDGLQALAKIKHLNSRLPVVMVSGYGHLQSSLEVIKLGASDYLKKPFGNEQLLETVQRFTSAVSGQLATNEQISDAPGVSEAAVVGRNASYKRAAALILISAIFAGWLFFRAQTDSYLHSYQAASANISTLFWADEDLWAGDWLSRKIYRYAKTPGGLELKKQYSLPKVHISGAAIAGGKLYLADSWRKVIEERALDDNLTIIKEFTIPGRITCLFYDGEYLWSCDADGAVVLRKPDSELSVVAYFKLPNRPDQIYKGKEFLWSAVSSTGKIYRHKLDDKLTLAATYLLKMPLGRDRVLSAFAWKDSRLWFTADSSAEIYESGNASLVKIN